MSARDMSLSGTAARPRLLSNMADVSLDTGHLVQRAVGASALHPRPGGASSRDHDYDVPQTPVSELSTPTTPHKHPLRLHQPPATPVPVLGIMPLCIARVAEGLMFGVIFPYINAMMHDFGVPEEQVGIWSATAESILMVTESFAAPLYAPLADRWGRRTILIPLLFGWGVFATGFGFASSPWGVVAWRAGLGTLAGAGVITRTMCGELCDKTNRIKGFALFSPAFTIGVTFAPLIGGFLSRPVPRLLSPSWTLFVAWPYLLPSLVVGLSGVLACWASYKWLPETLPPALRNKTVGRREAEKATQGASIRALLQYKKFQHVLVLYCLNNAVMFSWEAIFPLFGFTSPSLGGLGLNTQQIGVILAVSAGLSIAMTIWIFPRAHRAMDEGRLLRICLLCYPLAVFLFPLLWSLNAGRGTVTLPLPACIVLGLQMVVRRAGDFAATLLDTIVMDAIPGPEYLAMANSATFSCAAVGRAIGPFIVSTFFSLATTAPRAASLKRQLVWLVFIIVCLPSLYFGERVIADAAHSHSAAGESSTGKEWDEEHELLTPLTPLSEVPFDQ